MNHNSGDEEECGSEPQSNSPKNHSQLILDDNGAVFAMQN